MVNYKTYRNRCVSLIRDAKTTYYKTCVEDHKGDSKKLWQYLRDIIPTNLKTAPSSLRNNSDNSSISDPEDMCEHFNNFFSTIVNQYIAVQQFSSNFDKLSEMVNSRINSDDTFSIPQLTEEEVCSYLRNLNTHKATGLDGLSHKILKMSTYLIAPSLTKIFNKSLSSGMFPTKWKTSKIIPIYKSGAKCDVNNCRPIAILCAVSKVLERHVHNHLYQFLVSHSLLHHAQSGFRRNHSCETALCKLVDMWTSNMESGLINGAVFIDLRKAFDMVDTDLLLRKLAVYRCDDLTLTWFKSYLKERDQCVHFKGTLSSKKSSLYGVPQGSILGPLLFIMLINDLPLYVNSNTDMYADDSTIHTSARTVEELNNKLTEDMTNVQAWCTNNNMVINDGKTKAMMITTSQRAATLNSNLRVEFNGVQLMNTNSEKILGVVMNKHLSWKQQINKVAKSLIKGIHLLRQIKEYLPIGHREIYYKCFLQPHIDYCCTVWGQSCHIIRIHKLQKLALRIIYDKPKLTSSGPLFKAAGVLPIRQRVMLRTAIMVYKSLNNWVPKYISDMFVLKSSVTKRITRSSENNELWIPRTKLTIRQKTLKFSGATLYNSLPRATRQSTSLSSFKIRAYQYFLDTYI